MKTSVLAAFTLMGIFLISSCSKSSARLAASSYRTAWTWNGVSDTSSTGHFIQQYLYTAQGANGTMQLDFCDGDSITTGNYAVSSNFPATVPHMVGVTYFPTGQADYTSQDNNGTVHGQVTNGKLTLTGTNIPLFPYGSANSSALTFTITQN